jgi:hypothetical protein
MKTNGPGRIVRRSWKTPETEAGREAGPQAYVWTKEFEIRRFPRTKVAHGVKVVRRVYES